MVNKGQERMRQIFWFRLRHWISCDKGSWEGERERESAEEKARETRKSPSYCRTLAPVVELVEPPLVWVELPGCIYVVVRQVSNSVSLCNLLTLEYYSLPLPFLL